VLQNLERKVLVEGDARAIKEALNIVLFDMLLDAMELEYRG
jgi:hypothetical protein